MAQMTCSQIAERVRSMAGDVDISGGEIFTDTFCLRYIKQAFEMLVQAGRLHQIAEVRVISVPYTLAANTTTLTPATASWPNVSEVLKLEERPAGSTNPYTEVDLVEELTQRAQADLLREATYNKETFGFIGATQNIQLRLHYFESGSGESLTTGSTIAMEDAGQLLAAMAMAMGGPARGYMQEAQEAKAMAYGAGNPDPMTKPGGLLAAYLISNVRELQQKPVQRSAYQAGRFNRRR